jgi:hypothetical protein
MIPIATFAASAPEEVLAPQKLNVVLTLTKECIHVADLENSGSL